jgi:hypothetical protein
MGQDNMQLINDDELSAIIATFYGGCVDDVDGLDATSLVKGLAERNRREEALKAIDFAKGHSLYMHMTDAFGDGYEMFSAEWVRWKTIAAAHGNSFSATDLSVHYFNERDFARSLAYAMEAAHRGESAGALIAGGIFEEGWGVVRDPVEAVRWYCLAASLASDSCFIGDLPFDDLVVEDDRWFDPDGVERLKEMASETQCQLIDKVIAAPNLNRPMRKSESILELSLYDAFMEATG